MRLWVDFRTDSFYTGTKVHASRGDQTRMEKKRPATHTVTPIGRVLATILDQCRSNNGGGIVHLAQVWTKAVGPPISDHAKPFAVKGTLLLVHVSSSAWLHQLQFLKADLLDKLNGGLTHQRIEDIKFKIGPI